MSCWPEEAPQLKGHAGWGAGSCVARRAMLWQQGGSLAGMRAQGCCAGDAAAATCWAAAAIWLHKLTS